MRRTKTWAGIMVLPVMLAAAASSAQTPVGTAFSYQGQLEDGGAPVNDTCDLEFSLYDAAGPPDTQIGSTQTVTGAAVADGLFTVTLDFGSGAFAGDGRWLEIAVQCSADPGFTTLSPRQELTPTPHAVFASSAGDADTLDGAHGTKYLYDLSGSNRAFLAECNQYSDNDSISFSTPFSYYPVVVATAQQSGVIATVQSWTAVGFTLRLTDHDGTAFSGSTYVHWVAIGTR